jgi:hypothetical protein
MGLTPLERHAMNGRVPAKRKWLSRALFGFSGAASLCASASTSVLLIVGAPGQPEFGSNFVKQAERWQSTCTVAQAKSTTIGLASADTTNDYETLRGFLETEQKISAEPLWIVMIGHGTFDGKDARFNLRGPDVSATEMATWLQPFKRPMAIIITASSSAPFLNRLSATNRVIITATRSGHEQNYTRFGQYFAETLTNTQADLDKDGQVSLLEAFLLASRQTAEFYKAEERISTEHALIDDNGDGLGTPADWFQGLRAIKKASQNAQVDGLLARQFHLIEGESDQGLTAEQLGERDGLERAILLHREKKSTLPEEQYYQELEKFAVALARLYFDGSAQTQTPGPKPEAAH